MFQDIWSHQSRVRKADMSAGWYSRWWLVRGLTVPATNPCCSWRCRSRLWLWPSRWPCAEKCLSSCKDRQCLANLHPVGKWRCLPPHLNSRYRRVSISNSDYTQSLVTWLFVDDANCFNSWRTVESFQILAGQIFLHSVEKQILNFLTNVTFMMKCILRGYISYKNRELKNIVICTPSSLK